MKFRLERVKLNYENNNLQNNEYNKNLVDDLQKSLTNVQVVLDTFDKETMDKENVYQYKLQKYDGE
jgi:hypothetical protein